MLNVGVPKPYKVPRNCKHISHMLYVDDVLMFVNGKNKNMEIILKFIRVYESASGQKLNSIKSKFYVHHSVSSSKKFVIANVVGFQEGTLPFIYLGPPSYNKLTIQDYELVISKITKKVEAQKWCFLFMGGKITLIQTVLSTIPKHILVVLNPPKKVFQRIDKDFSQFFWGHAEGKYKKSWRMITKPKT